MKITSTFVGLILIIFSLQVHADGWATFGKQSEMKGHVITDVGEASQVEPPFNTKWDRDVYQINGRCFYFLGYIGHWGYGGKAAFLLVNAQRETKIAIFETSIGSVKADLQSVILVQCPNGTNVIPYSDDPTEQLKLLQKRQEELKRKLEQLQRQR